MTTSALLVVFLVLVAITPAALVAIALFVQPSHQHPTRIMPSRQFHLDRERIRARSHGHRL
jgi:hypothetical protein